MTCNHPIGKLIGTANGVTCKACGKALTPEEYRRHLHPPDKPEKTPDKQPRTRKKVQDDAEP